MTHAQALEPALTEKICSACDTSFGCGAQSPEKSCWCESLPQVGPIAGPEKDCLCPDCLANEILRVEGLRLAEEPPAPVVEGADFYWEGPAMVFTAAYLARRGYCCESGCRHCPYGTRA